MDIIYFSLDAWYSVTQRVHHIARHLSQQNRVLFVNPVARSALGYIRNHIFGDRKRNFLPKLKTITENLSVFYGPPLFHFSQQFQVINRTNHKITIGILQTYFKQLNFDQPILWVTSPLHVEVIGKFHERLSVYDCMDNHSAFHNIGSQLSRINQLLEKQLISKVDVVFCTSRNLEQRIRKLHHNVNLSQNAVSDTFLQPQCLGADLPEDFPNSNNPKIGFIGTVYSWVDVDALVKMAETHPEWDIIIIGPLHFQIKIQKPIKNLFFLGKKPYDILPQYLSRFDVGLIPFKINELTIDVNPVKLYEYFAFGIPVVSTTLPEVIQYKDLCYIAEKPSDLSHQVALALQERTHSGFQELITKRKIVASQNTWKSRVQTIQQILNNSLNLKVAINENRD